MPSTKSIAILGTVGLPAQYGGFETLVENLVHYREHSAASDVLTVYCSSRSYPERTPEYLTARLKYIPLQANGVQSIPYDFLSLVSAVWNRNDVILLLGVSGAIALPLVRLVSSARVVTNIDGKEWRREKWRGLAKKFLRFSERIAVRYSHEVISDNAAIADYVKDTYGVNSHVIAYGGDHAVAVDAVPVDEYSLPDKYAFSVCRIEPENNVHIIVEAFSAQETIALVLVGNWENSDYGRDLRHRYQAFNNLYLLDPIYDLGKLKTLRSKAAVYLHGHSAGGTNPSLVEAMHFGVPIIAFDCDFNRSTTEDRALYFSDVESLRHQIITLDDAVSEKVGKDMVEIAQRRYTWAKVAEQYFALLHDRGEKLKGEK
ncbi:DUF1972 domain-containing protein [Thiohalomonas denitrificans]|uniref:Glycosyltransferase involved in cell wall bisynthesis n=1 Tax=Thiohalomonas denitrificans TaxID=415747 RepID=A0A1G5QZN2_9GAMM|nr:DUF1972 domain-containing protein [Thiohalomonas denitrificans]SCZ67273.1 Glycosyltransferase involved in cell wall bisynthesis [Thiohalomonas denitrificans]